MKSLIAGFTEEEQMRGLNDAYEATDGNALFHFRHWVKSQDDLLVRVYVDTSVVEGEHSKYITAFREFLESYDFEVQSEFEEIDDGSAEYKGEVAYEAVLGNPYSSGE